MATLGSSGCWTEGGDVLDAVVAALVFLAGLVIGVRMLAALYAPIDLWYTIRTAWPVAVRRIVGWAVVTAAALLLTDGGCRWALLAGLGVTLLLHVGAWVAISVASPRRPGPTPVVE